MCVKCQLLWRLFSQQPNSIFVFSNKTLFLLCTWALVRVQHKLLGRLLAFSGHASSITTCSVHVKLKKTNKQKHSPTSVSFGRNAHFQNQVSSRLRKTPLILRKYRLVHAKHLLWVVDHAVEDANGTGNDCRCIL